jgi:hypothetical protein
LSRGSSVFLYITTGCGGREGGCVDELLLVSLRGAERKAWLDGFVDSHAGAFLNTAVFEWVLEL